MATKRTGAVAGKAKKEPAAASPAADETRAPFGAQGYSMAPEEVERSLRTGQHAGALEDYFGSKQYEELRLLAQEASRPQRRGGPRVLILPGILGSTIGKNRPGHLLDDVYWFDPVDIALGRLPALALGERGKSSLEPIGVILLSYLKLKLSLKIDGYDADFFPYDWRRPIQHSAQKLLARLGTERSGEIHLVAHSMGGLVARAAIGLGEKRENTAAAEKIRRLVMLGTPNHGSFAPIEAIRATYGVVKKIEWLDQDEGHTAAWYAHKVFSTFPGLCQMLPTSAKYGGLGLFDCRNWPSNEPQPRQEILDQVEALHRLLARGNERMTMIAGVNLDTTVNARIEGDHFVYEVTRAGDGTVPLDYALLDGVQTFYVEEKHGSLPNNRRVERAVADILDRGDTERLLTSWTPPPGPPRVVLEIDLLAPKVRKRGPEEAPSQRELRHFLDDFAAPDAREEGPQPTAIGPATVIAPFPTTGYGHRITQVTVARRTQHHLDIVLARGSITDVNVRACVLGVFAEVAPSGAAAAIDEMMDGAVTELTRRRMFQGSVGEIFIMPATRSDLLCDEVVFVGLGTFDSFTAEVQQIVAENVIRTLVRTYVEEFATVLIGAASGRDVATTLQNLLVGFIRGLTDADRTHRFRRIVLCENDPQVFEQMKEELVRLSTTDLCKQIQIVFDEKEPLARTRHVARDVVRSPAPVYLIVRQEDSTPNGHPVRLVHSALLTAGGKAAVITETQELDRPRLDTLLDRLDTDFGPDEVKELGTEVAELMLAQPIRQVLASMKDRHLVVVHDSESSRVPWETLYLEGWHPAAGEGLSHNYLAPDLSVAKWLEQRQEDDNLDLLLVVDPTQDLGGARAEGNMVRAMFQAIPGVRLHELRGAKATRPAVLSAIRSGAYDVLHYAGHAYFDTVHPERSGILCHQKQVISGADLVGVGNLPTLMFFNACESGRLRKPEPDFEPEPRVHDHSRREWVEHSSGLAEAMLRGGVANYVGTYWPVGDASATEFAGIFYRSLLAGDTIASALHSGRTAVKSLAGLAGRDWADYIHYGYRDFVLKKRPH